MAPGRPQLLRQRFRECTLAMPTWFCSRAVFDRVGGFVETGPGAPEDMDFFYRHLRAGGTLARVPEPLPEALPDQQSRGVSAEAIWSLRVAELQGSLLDGLPSFSIWSAGRDGKRLYRSLSTANQDSTQSRVVAFLDVDAGKLAAGLYYNRERKLHVPIVEWRFASDARYQPAVICVKLGLHDGFEENLASLQLREGEQYWHFC
ncbi:unnamed protein product [Prorocentrum cordatum]|uniref:Uncharacterized protein n=1 Tax=Prorocentrum cordatum TaxID=2364126 RepID=A0ABN9Q9X5_9DINO|nr:unnamed protein product [Polarella glacialis]